MNLRSKLVSTFFCLVRRRGAKALSLCLALSGGFCTRPAAAQALEDEFAVQRFNPAPGPRNFITTRGARTDGEMGFSVGLMANYAFEPFTIRTCTSDDGTCDDADQITEVPVVENLVTGDLMGTLTPIPRLQLGLRVPITWVKGQGIREDGSANPDGLSAVGLGDAELEGKLRLYGEIKDPIVLGLAVFATAPLGTATSEGNYIGDSTPTLGGRAIFDGLQGPLSFAANLGGVWRGTGTVGPTELGPEFRYGVGVGYQVSPVLRAVLDGFGSSNFSSDSGANALEAALAAQIQPLNSPFIVSVGAGTGLGKGIGVPTLRALLGVLVVLERKDRDSDGLFDDQDQCPTEAEDRDGYEDGDGCPDLDNDLDTIADDVDQCPREAEDFDGFEDTDGCPDPDNDKDGIIDTSDRCPLEPETKNNYNDEDGCPDVPDSDGDGVPDPQDQCPNDVEDTDGFNDTDGCPDPDNDNDGIPDIQDECLDEPETVNGFEDEDGCPDEAPEAPKGRRR
jgi:hypothetical protein